MADAILKTEGNISDERLDILAGIAERSCFTASGTTEVAKALRELQALRLSATAEASRLDWAMRHIPGRVFSDLGVTYSAGPDRDAIDAAMTLESANGR